jgi:antitoxin component YwqK of YwqJK toxin-antitoxin module
MSGLYKIYHPNGAIKQIYYAMNGLIEGPIKQFCEKGLLLKIGNFIDGKQHGPQYSFITDSDGNQFDYLTETFVDDKKEGPTICFYKKNSIKKIENYKQNKLHGTVTEYYPNGIIQSISEYIDGHQETYKEYHSNGVLHRSIIYVNNWIADGHYVEYHNNQQQKRIFTIMNRQRFDEYREFYPNGQEQIICFYNENEKLNGEMRTYHDNGQLKSLETYINGNKHGRCEYFYKSGRFRLINNYNMGKLVDDYKRMRPNGDIIRHYRYVAGKRHLINPNHQPQ